MPTLLASGFGPFPGAPDNASWDALECIRPNLPPGWRLRRLPLDVAWHRAVDDVIAAIDDDTRAVVAFGQADDDPIRLERFALNAPSRDLEDVDGLRLNARWIVATGPAAYESSLPIEALLTSIEIQGARLVESHYAGSYLCNFTFYRLMHLAATRRPDLVAGFVHVPPAARLDLATTASVMERLIEAVAAHAASSA